jgi:hypothetical protein
MNTEKEIKLLRIFMSNTDKYDHQPLYEHIVYAAHKQGLAGATVLKGVLSFGSSSVINSLKLWETSEKLPVIIEIIDETEKIESFFESLKLWFEKSEKGFLATIEKVNVVYYKTGKNKH